VLAAAKEDHQLVSCGELYNLIDHLDPHGQNQCIICRSKIGVSSCNSFICRFPIPSDSERKYSWSSFRKKADPMLVGKLGYMLQARMFKMSLSQASDAEREEMLAAFSGE
jgi:hypothetical protein